MNYVKLIEHSEWEGETWYFYIPCAGNEDKIKELKALVKAYDEYGDTYAIEDTELTESQVDTLVQYGGDHGYMNTHNKLVGIMTQLPKLDKDNDELYKGGIGQFFSKP